MRLGVISDTHGNLTEMRRAVTRLLEEFKVDVLIHLGDDSTDADEFSHLGLAEVIFVPGVFESRYKDEKIPNRLIKEFNGVYFLLTHTPTKDIHDLPEDIDPTAAAEDGDVSVVLHGHTHLYRAEERHGAVYVCPGHLNPRDNRSNLMTIAVIDVNPPKLDVKIVELDNGVILDKRFFVDQSSNSSR